MAGLRHRYVWSAAVAPGDPEIVIVSADAGLRWMRLDFPWPEELQLQHVQGLAVVRE